MNSFLKKPKVERDCMTDKELIDRIYDRCPEPFKQTYTIDQFVDRCQDIRDMIDRHNGKGKGWKQEQAGLDY